MVYDRNRLDAPTREQMRASVTAEEAELDAAARGVYNTDLAALPGRQSGSEAWRQVSALPFEPPPPPLPPERSLGRTGAHFGRTVASFVSACEYLPVRTLSR